MPRVLETCLTGDSTTTYRAAALKLARREQEVIVFDYPDERSIHWTEEPLLTPC
jgi:hypothetical protein